MGLGLVCLMKYSIFVGILIGLICVKSLFFYEELNGLFMMDELNWLMALLTLVLLLMVLFECGKMLFSLVVMMGVLYLIAVVNSLVVFFMLYEFLFVLIMFSILILGHSFERLVASFTMMFYSLLFSSPTPIMLIIMDGHYLLLESLEYGALLIYYIVCSFIVKFPIFSFHYWLPVAHAEASTLGSIILAGVLLKMGGLGVRYVTKFLKFMVKLHWLMAGYSLMMMVILFLSDLKTMVAYSSVAHMSFMFYVMMLGLMVGSNGSVLMMFYHGIISSLMFWSIGVSSRVKTRSLMVTKLVSFSGFPMVLIIVVLLSNMGLPPFMGFLSEILMLKSILSLGNLVIFFGSLGVLFSCYHNIFMHWGFNGVSNSHLVMEIKFLNVFLMVLVAMLFINYF